MKRVLKIKPKVNAVSESHIFSSFYTQASVKSTFVIIILDFCLQGARKEAPKTSPSPGQLKCSGKFSLPLSTGGYIYRLFLPPETWHDVLKLRIGE